MTEFHEHTLEERKAGVVCAVCGEQRWPPVGTNLYKPYACFECKEGKRAKKSDGTGVRVAVPVRRERAATRRDTGSVRGRHTDPEPSAETGEGSRRLVPVAYSEVSREGSPKSS